MSENNYFDLQINGYAGVDFNKDDLTADELHHVCEQLDAHGVGGILATLVTETMDKMLLRLLNIVKYRAADPLATRMIAGFHIEGPFLNETPGYKGAHPVDAIHPADLDEMKQLLDAAGGLTKLVTLAPERDDAHKVTKYLAGQGITVSAGHCDPSLDELKAAIDAGISMFTHLGNGCPMQMHRHDNIVQRALALHDRLWLCFIVDGAHVAFHALQNYLRSIDLDRCVIVTDDVAPASLGPGTYTLGRWTLVIGDDMVARAPDGSHLVGAAITMEQSEANLINKVGLSRADARRLLCDNPRRAIGMA